MRRSLIVLALLLTLAPVAAAQETEDALVEQAVQIFRGTAKARDEVIDALVKRGKPDAIPVLVLALRFSWKADGKIVAALEKLSGAKPGKDWNDWMVWQETHPETGVIPGFVKLQERVYTRIDPNFSVFLKAGAKHEIRMEEIAWGGVRKDGIPALTNPAQIPAGTAKYLKDDDLVFGVAINGDARAYPLRILDWHEMFNDVVGGVPVSLAYCTLCGSGILFEAKVEGREKPFVFGSSGFLYRSNKLMYDTETHSLWNQFTGRPVVGELTGSGLTLKTRPVVITRWTDWKAANPKTTVLSAKTGHARDYSPGAAYSEYFSSPDLMFPTHVDQTKLKQKDYVFALRSSGADKAWPLKLFEGGAVLNDKAGILDIVLVGDAATRTVRAYRSEGLTFEKGAKTGEVRQGTATWKVTEEALVGPDGKALPRLPGHIAYWFAWHGYLGKTGELAEPKR